MRSIAERIPFTEVRGDLPIATRVAATADPRSVETDPFEERGESNPIDSAEIRQLHYVDPPLAGFDLGNERCVRLKVLGYLGLRQGCFLPYLSEHLQQTLVTDCVAGFWHFGLCKGCSSLGQRS